MKRIISLLLALTLFISLAGCKQIKQDIENSTENNSSASGSDTEEQTDEFLPVSETATALSNVNVRTSCSHTSDSIGVLFKGETIQRTGYTSEWSRVIFDGMNCYIASEYLSASSAEGQGPGEAGSEESSSSPSNPQESAPSDPSNQSSPSLPDTPVSGTELAPAITPVDVDTSNIPGLDNTPIAWGYASDQRDEYNRPLGAVQCQQAYGGYSADFLKGNTNIIYLTFDEGYEFGCTPAILDTLKEKNVKAVFFITLPYAKSQPELVQRMIDEGHVVGNHSDSHPAQGMPSLGMDGVIADMSNIHQYVLDTFGYEMYLFRHPAGIYSPQTLAISQSLGYRSVFWSFAHKDWITDDQPDPAAALEKCVNQLHPGAIYLLHAVSTTNTQILGDFIDQAQAAGYTFGYYAR